MSRGARWVAAIACAGVAVALLVPAAADWLVLRDGSRVETAGPWRVESRVVVFKRPDGTYASLRLSDVDLDASRRITLEEAERVEREDRRKAAEPGASERREPVLRLTEKDLPPVEPPPGGDEDPDQETSEEPDAPESLEIVTWREVGGVETPGIEIVGTVRNNSDSLAIGVGVTAVLYDQAGEESARAQAILTSTALQPTQTSAFRVSFPGVYQYGRADLTASGNLIRTEQPDPEEDPPGAGS